MNRSLLFLLTAVGVAIAQTPPRLEFEVRWSNPPEHSPAGCSHQTLRSKAMSQEVGFNVCLPAQYAGSASRYPVIYWLHGSGGNESGGLFIAEHLARAVAS